MSKRSRPEYQRYIREIMQWARTMAARAKQERRERPNAATDEFHFGLETAYADMVAVMRALAKQHGIERDDD